MKNIKIIFFDIDGTLIDVDTKKVTPKMLETLKGKRDYHLYCYRKSAYGSADF